MNCVHCSKHIEPDSHFCPYCNHPCSDFGSQWMIYISWFVTLIFLLVLLFG
ncbi:MAG: hypothetical protein RR090_11185 [Niameybacter sp.]|uniref:hypothetical protein n=1 Tax=Niameybacter sp. TaxID=2033640 RepID=UPI002FC95F2B